MYPYFDYQKAMPTPWGKADGKHKICDGVYSVTTPGHGGILVGKKAARKLLSDRALKVGFAWGSWYAFEEDCACSVFIYEQTKLWAEMWNKRNPSMVRENPDQCTVESWKESARKSLERWYPDYFQKAQLKVGEEMYSHGSPGDSD